MSDLEKAIVKTIIYFDIFDFPLTAFEVWKNLYGCKAGLEEVRVALESNAVLKTKINQEQGFYFPIGRESIIETRLARYNIAAKKFKRVIKVARILAIMPFIKMISVCNNLAYSNAREESDLDLFIVTARERIWAARFFSALFLKIFHLRPTDRNAKDKICLSFFVSENNLNLQGLAMEEDIYFFYWLCHLLPIYDSRNIFSDIVRNNQWIRETIPNYFPVEKSSRRQISLGAIGRTIKKFEELIVSIIPQNFFKKIQLNNLAPNLKRLANLDTRVMINDQVLKFHANDRREEFRKIFEDRIAKYI
jgi:hypothetical protein